MVTDAHVHRLGRDAWDAIVIGAGVAGASSAISLMRHMGRGGSRSRVLLLERGAWPRPKVCGCCINRAGVEQLERLGVLDELRASGAPAIERVRLHRGRSEVTLRQPGGMVVARSVLDAALVDAAVRAGAVFAHGRRAAVLADDGGRNGRTVHVRDAAGEWALSARIVVVADGLNGGALDALPEFEPRVARGSWFGVGGTIEGTAAPAGTIEIFMAEHGYVGLVQIDDCTANLGAALDPAWARAIGGPSAAVERIIKSCGADAEKILAMTDMFKGTALLTRSRRTLAAPGVLVVGDAAGYVEPFTGEGMAWSLASGCAAGRLAAGALTGVDIDLARAWANWHAREIGRRQRMCRLIRAAVHRPLVAGVLMSLASRHQWFAAAMQNVGESLSRPYLAQRVSGVAR